MKETLYPITLRDGASLNCTVYEADDPKPPRRDVLLLHGWPNAGRVWRYVAEALLLAGHYRLIAPDLRGFGDSEPPPSRHSCAAFAEDIAQVAESLGLSRYAVVGHSMGGKFAQVFAARQPHGLAGLVLLTPAPLVATPTPDEKKAAQKAAAGSRDQAASLALGMAARPLDAERQALLIEDALRTAPEAWHGWIDTWRDEDLTPEAARIAVPTLVIGGEKDRLRTEEVLRRDVVERIPGATLTTLPAVGHLPHLEEPTALALLLVNFLDTLPEGD